MSLLSTKNCSLPPSAAGAQQGEQQGQKGTVFAAKLLELGILSNTHVGEVKPFCSATFQLWEGI